MTVPNATLTREAPWPPEADTREYRWVHVWHLPIRFMHWIAAIAIVVLMATGVFMARPGLTSGSPSWSFALQWVRLAHFSAAGALVATAIVRLYWLFVGNKWERWSALFPVRARDWKNLWSMVRYYLFVHPERAGRYLGHNPLAQVVYTLTYLIALALVLTGFVMFGAANPGGTINTLFGWMTPLFGGLPWVRAIHHALGWFFPPFIILHVYLAVRTELTQRGGLVSSMMTGGVFVPSGERYVDE